MYQKYLTTLLITVISLQLSMGQNPTIDSFLQLLPTLSPSEKRIDALNDLAWELKEDNPTQARNYTTEAINLAISLQYYKGEAQAYNNRGILENIHGNFAQAIEYFEKALPLRQKINDTKGIAALHNNIGNAYEDMGKNIDALGEYKKSLVILEQLNEPKRVARVHYNIGLLQERMGNYFEALNEQYNYLTIVEQQNDQEGIAKAYTIIGHIKSELEFFAEAEEYYQKAYAIRSTIGDSLEIANAMLNLGNGKSDNNKPSEALALYENALRIYNNGDYPTEKSNALNNIGVAYKDLNNYPLALKKFEDALAIRLKSEDKRGVMETYNGIGDVKRRQKDAKAALYYVQQYYTIANEIKDDKFIQKSYKDFALAYEMLGDYRQALTYRVKYDEYRYSRLNERRLRDFEQRDAVFGDYKKQLEIEKQKQQIQQANTLRNSLIGAAVALLLISLLLYNRYTAKNQVAKVLEQKNEIIAQEQQRSDELLLNILPEATARELKATGQAKAQYYEQVTVLFTDFRAFTQVAEQLSAQELVQELDYCFKAFDAIIEKYQVEKIKTIGDAYMCVSGLPTPNPQHATNAVNAGLEMQAFIAQYNHKRIQTQQNPLEMRLGIHSGAVIAGVVGSKKFAFDIWGDTVNIASRMESAGEIGRVNISESVLQLVQNDFFCEPRGKIAVKNKGEIEMYFVNPQI